MESYGIIYCATNTINNNKYIGQTIRGLDIRKKEHDAQAKSGSKYFLHLAISKYGFDKMDWSIIDLANDRKELDEKEIYWINYYNTYKDGYNMTLGGQGFNKDVNNIIEISIEERLEKRIEHLKQKSNDNHPFYIFDKQGNFIDECDNRLLFCAENNITTGHVLITLRNEKPSVDNFVLIYIEDYSEENLKQRLKRIRYNRDFVVFNKDKQYIGTWQNQLCCERELGLTRGCINKCLTNVVKIINGYYFYYFDECPDNLKELCK